MKGRDGHSRPSHGPIPGSSLQLIHIRDKTGRNLTKCRVDHLMTMLLKVKESMIHAILCRSTITVAGQSTLTPRTSIAISSAPTTKSW